MPRHSRLSWVVTSLVVAALPGVAHAAKPALAVSKVKAIGVAATGGPAALSVTVTNRGHHRSGRSHVNLTLNGTPLKAAHTAVPKLGPKHRKTLKVTTVALPAALLPGAQFSLKVCAGASCATTKPVLVTEATIGALTEAAVRLHVISAGTAALYLARSAAGDARLPVPFRLPATPAAVDDHAAVVQATALYPTLSAADRKRLAPYLMPAAIRRYTGKHTHHTRAGTGTSCVGTSSITGRPVDFSFAVPDDYQGIPAAGNKAVVWFAKDRPQDRSSALAYAAALDVAWPKLTGQFTAPLSDADRACLNAGDGRFDVYVDGSIGNRAQTLPEFIWDPSNATTHGLRFKWPGCTHVPAYIQIRPNLAPWVLAHELMHAIQFAYTYKDCEGYQNGWWDEGSATWAGDYVYPADNTEREWLEAFTEPSVPLWRLNGDYATWPFWYFLVKSQGVGVMNRVFAQLASQTSRAAVNAAIPGGFAKQYPIYQQWLANATPPVGSPGFPLAKSYLGYDGLGTRVTQASDTALTLTGGLGHAFVAKVISGAEGDYCVPLAVATLYRVHSGNCHEGFLGPESGVVQHFTLPDDNVRAITFKNGLTGKPGEHVEAWYRIADGTWKTADWSGDESKLCRDTTDEDARDLYVVSANTAATGEGFAAKGLQHIITVANSCPFPKRFDGTWTRVYEWPGRGTWKETVTGTISFLRNPVFPPEADATSSIPYELGGGTVTWSVTGGIDDAMCPTTFSGSGSLLASSDTSFGTPTELSLEKVTGHPGAPDPEPQPYWYSIRIGQDPQTAPSYDVINCEGTTQETIVLPYLDIGDPRPLSPDNPPQKEIKKSADATHLAGHRAGTDEDKAGFEVDDTWDFTGSG